MNIFEIHNAIMSDYQSYIRSFINIADEEIFKRVEQELDEGKLWSEPLLQFNPSFEDYGNVEELVKEGLLHSSLSSFFKGYRLYKHQVDAYRLGMQKKGFVVTSGTGSGKSLTYIGTIFSHLMQQKPSEGIQAVIVYPMNALINSQTEELGKYFNNYREQFGKEPPFTFGQYTGQEKQEVRKRLQESPPNILLTNYMMLELLLTRSKERPLRNALYKNLQFIVFDELHTYRGRQGADVGMLIRRIRAKAAQEPICIGTSATMVSGNSSLEAQRKAVAEVATLIFGQLFTSNEIIRETLQLSFTNVPVPDQRGLAWNVKNPVPIGRNPDDLAEYPTAIWLENEVALERKEDELVRRKPMTQREIIRKLAAASDCTEEDCKAHLVHLLAWIDQVNEELKSQNKRYTYLPFKLHQFIAQTGAVYTTLGPHPNRIITLESGNFDGHGSQKRPLFPNVFSRMSGENFLCVQLDKSTMKLAPLPFRDGVDDEESKQAGYIIPNLDMWKGESDHEQLPNSWLQFSKKENKHIIVKRHRERMPRQIWFNEQGQYKWTDHKDFPLTGWYMSAPLLFDPTAGVFFDPNTREGTKLSQLGVEGRSTSTTINALAVLNALKKANKELEDVKLLSFTDNRQDAALQAGHFNDFIHVLRIRSSIYQALANKSDGLTLEDIGDALQNSINLPFREYSNYSGDTDPFPHVKDEFNKAFRTALTYQALYDLRRGWRVVLPNLEQCGLLWIDYRYLNEVAGADDQWRSLGFAEELTADDRRELFFQTLEFIRREYALSSETYLTNEQIDKHADLFREKLTKDWQIAKKEWGNGENDKFHPKSIRLHTLHQRSNLNCTSAAFQSAYGKYLRRFLKEKLSQDLGQNDYQLFIEKYFNFLEAAGYLKSESVRAQNGEEVKVYRLKADSIIWKAGDGKTVPQDDVRQASYKMLGQKPNKFFRDLYRLNPTRMKKLVGADHTGQLRNDDRKEREDLFRKGDISALFCSPTMELGIDIKDLSVVHMRNAPPNPANYAQRSGRAGRSGQAALVFTYCSGYSPHDRHYFLNQKDLVAGSVTPPRMDLCNRELLSSHLNALILSEIGLSQLEESIVELLDIQNQDLPLQLEVTSHLELITKHQKEYADIFRKSISSFESMLYEKHSHWYSPDWALQEAGRLQANLDHSLGRWRDLYKQMDERLRENQKIQSDPIYAKEHEKRKEAEREIKRALMQRDQLMNSNNHKGDERSEFYPFRYLAAEGFLPGYNFTRLPLRAKIDNDESEYISRPRMVALREFGPENLIYHKGEKYVVKRMNAQNLENSVRNFTVSRKAGFFLSGAHETASSCPLTDIPLKSDETRQVLTQMLEMGEGETRRRERITCEEEERTRLGYQIQTYFSTERPQELPILRIVDGENLLLKIRFIPTATLLHVNQGWRNRERERFLINLATGFWNPKVKEGEQTPPTFREVSLFTTDTADALYLEPMDTLGLGPDGVLTLQYALKRAIENTFQVEPSEIGASAMGDAPNLLLYEASEGSLGVLSQFLERKEVFHQVVTEAQKLCRFDDKTYSSAASYDDLLSYYNQPYHQQLDRFLIKEALETLSNCNVELQQNASFGSYEEQLQAMLRQADPKSQLETKFLNYLGENGLKLPDAAQKTVPGIYCQPDFFYEPDVWVFCDGSVHDDAEVREKDRAQRSAIREQGHQVLVLSYKDTIESFVQKRPDIFTKVR